jgi:hypothetical protein
MKKQYQVSVMATVRMGVVVEVETDDPYEDTDWYYDIDEALYDYKKYNLEEQLIKQLMTGEAGTVNFTVDSYEEINEREKQ